MRYLQCDSFCNKRILSTMNMHGGEWVCKIGENVFEECVYTNGIRLPPFVALRCGNCFWQETACPTVYNASGTQPSLWNREKCLWSRTQLLWMAQANKFLAKANIHNCTSVKCLRLEVESILRTQPPGLSSVPRKGIHSAFMFVSFPNVNNNNVKKEKQIS